MMANPLDLKALPPLGKYVVERIVVANDKISQAEEDLIKASLIARGQYTKTEFKSFVVENSKVLSKMPRLLRAAKSLNEGLTSFMAPKGVFLLLICRAMDAFAADYSSPEVPEEFIESLATYNQLIRLGKAKWLSLLNDTEWSSLVPTDGNPDEYVQGGNLKSKEILEYAKKKKPDLDLKSLMDKIRERSDRNIVAFERKIEADLLSRFEVEDMLKLYLGYYSNSRASYQKKLEQLSDSFQQKDIETLQKMGDEALEKGRGYSQDERKQLIDSIEKVRSGFPAIFKKSDVPTVGGILKKITSEMNRSIAKEWLLYACRFHKLALQQVKRLLESYTEKTDDEKIDRRDFLDKNKFIIKGQCQLTEYSLNKFHDAIADLDKLVSVMGKSEMDEDFKELEEFKKIYNELVGRKRPQDDARRLRGFLLTNARFKGLLINYNLYDLYEQFFVVKMPTHDYFKSDQGAMY